jgi:hypothetical protein
VGCCFFLLASSPRGVPAAGNPCAGGSVVRGSQANLTNCASPPWACRYDGPIHRGHASGELVLSRARAVPTIPKAEGTAAKWVAILFAGTPQQTLQCVSLSPPGDHLLPRTLLSVADFWIIVKILPRQSTVVGRAKEIPVTSRPSSHQSDHALRSIETLKRHGHVERQRTGPGRVSSVEACAYLEPNTGRKSARITCG